MSFQGVFGEWLAAAGYSPDYWRRLPYGNKLALRSLWAQGAKSSQISPSEAYAAPSVGIVEPGLEGGRRLYRSKP